MGEENPSILKDRPGKEKPLFLKDECVFFLPQVFGDEDCIKTWNCALHTSYRQMYRSYTEVLQGPYYDCVGNVLDCTDVGWQSGGYYYYYYYYSVVLE